MRGIVLCALLAIAAFADGRSDRVDALFAQWDTAATPGAAVAVIRDGAIVYEQGYGVADLEHAVPVTPDSVFYICSVSKQFTGFAIALLAARGTIDLDSPIGRYLPELPAYAQVITVRQLVHHTSGIRDLFALESLRGFPPGSAVITLPRTLALIARQKRTDFPPGTDYAYSNSGYVLLSVIVQRATGKSLRAFAAEEIFAPLGMGATTFLDDLGMVIPNRAFGYVPDNGAYALSMPQLEIVGDGGLYTSVRDLAKWDAAYYTAPFGDDAREIWLTRGKLANGNELEYAFGIVHGTYHGLKTVSHGGALTGYRAVLMRFPEQRFSVIILANTGEMNPESLAFQIAEIYLEGEFKKSAQKPQRIAGGFRTYTGDYFDAESGTVWKALAEDGGPVLQRGGWQFALEPAGGGRFEPVAPNPYRAFTFTRDGDHWTLALEREGGLVERAQEIRLISPGEVPAGDYAGRYYSEELDAAYVVATSETGITVQLPGRDAQPLTPIVRDWFSARLGSLHFVRGAAGAVSGIEVSSGRARGIAFKRIVE